MNNQRTSLTLLLTLVGAFVTGPVLAGCGSDCIAIYLPPDNMPPEVDKQELTVAGGTGFSMELSGESPVRIDFGDRTPVVNPGGQLVYRFIVNPGAQRLDVVEECDSDGCEYKYSVAEVNSDRPALDPVIIIER